MSNISAIFYVPNAYATIFFFYSHKLPCVAWVVNIFFLNFILAVHMYAFDTCLHDT